MEKSENKVLKKVKQVLSYIFVDGMSGMALGLFATLIIGTIIENVGKLFGGAVGSYIIMMGQAAKFMMGAGIGLGIGYKLKRRRLSPFPRVLSVCSLLLRRLLCRVKKFVFYRLFQVRILPFIPTKLR